MIPLDDHIDAAMEQALRHNLSVYDAADLAVATHLGARLFTADEALAKTAQAAGA